jgi:hypothetical protein
MVARNRLAIVVAAGLAVLLLALLARSQVRPVGPIEVVLAWEAARNAHDVDGAMALVADDATIFGISARTANGRAWHRSVLAAQAIAGHTVRDSDCVVVAGELVTCRYAQEDAFLRRCGLTLTGEHRFLVRDGKLALAIRRHDPASRDAVYTAVEAFRGWVESLDPAAEAVIWWDANSVFYTKPEGATSMLALLDGYACSGVEPSRAAA